MNRFVIMTVGRTHSGKTTFAKKLESVLEQAIVIDQDNHAEFINQYYKKIRPNEGPNTLKFTITNAIVKYAIESSDLHKVMPIYINLRDQIYFVPFMKKDLKRLLFTLSYPQKR